MRPSSPGGRTFAPYVLAIAGIGYLGYKAEFLALETSDALKAFIVSPAAALFILAVFAGFPDARRRAGGSLLALGFVALVWLSQAPMPPGWIFDTPVSALSDDRLPSYFKGPSPLLTAFATSFPFLGWSLAMRRSAIGGLLLGAAIWCALCFAPSRWSFDPGMPHRDAYYSDPGRSPRWFDHGDRSDALLPILLGLGGLALIGKAGPREERRGADAPG